MLIKWIELAVCEESELRGCLAKVKFVTAVTHSGPLCGGEVREIHGVSNYGHLVIWSRTGIAI
jgi:hypothetical protein